jgi:hypothetical protein
MTSVMKEALGCGLIVVALAGFTMSAQAQADLSKEQKTEAYQATVGARTSSPHRPAGFNVQVGDTVPGSAPTYKMPESVKDKAIRRYEYMVIDNRMVLVDPSSRKIIEVVR